MPYLYGVTFPEPIGSLPRRCQSGIPGRESWEKWPGWSISVKNGRVFIYQEPIDLTDENATGVPLAAKDEHAANGKDDKSLRLVYSVPAHLAILHYVDVGDAKITADTAPSKALLALLAERKANPPPPPKPAVPVPGAYAGPPVTPARRGPQPPGNPRPVEPPPSEIVLEE